LQANGELPVQSHPLAPHGKLYSEQTRNKAHTYCKQ
jgi:hypothetical protein